MDRPSKEKINKGTEALNDTLGQMDLTDIFRTFHSKTVEYIFFSSHMERSPEKIMIGHKSLKLKKD